MEILQKNPYFIFCMATVTLPQQYNTLKLIPRVQFLTVGYPVQNDCNKAPTSDCSREHLAPL